MDWKARMFGFGPMKVDFNTCQKNQLQDGLRDFDHVMLNEHDRLRLIIAVWNG